MIKVFSGTCLGLLASDDALDGDIKSGGRENGM